MLNIQEDKTIQTANATITFSQLEKALWVRLGNKLKFDTNTGNIYHSQHKIECVCSTGKLNGVIFKATSKELERWT